jgi:hypothetical protein
MIITSIKKLIVDSATLSLGKPGSPEKEYPSIRPGKKWVKALVVKIIFIVLGRAFQSGSRHDLEIQREISVWPENFVIIMNVFPEGPRMVLEKIHDKLIYQGNKFIRSDLVINFKNIECAFMVLTPQIGPAQAFAEKRMTVAGDLADAMIFTRCLNIMIAYLYPEFICKRLLKRVPAMTVRKQLNRVIIYMAGIPLGM